MLRIFLPVLLIALSVSAKAVDDEFRAAYRELQNQYRNGEITFAEYRSGVRALIDAQQEGPTQCDVSNHNGTWELTMPGTNNTCEVVITANGGPVGEFDGRVNCDVDGVFTQFADWNAVYSLQSGQCVLPMDFTRALAWRDGGGVPRHSITNYDSYLLAEQYTADEACGIASGSLLTLEDGETLASAFADSYYEQPISNTSTVMAQFRCSYLVNTVIGGTRTVLQPGFSQTFCTAANANPIPTSNCAGAWEERQLNVACKIAIGEGDSEGQDLTNCVRVSDDDGALQVQEGAVTIRR